MKIKVYTKRGNQNFREKRYIKEITEKLQSNQDLLQDFEPANNFEELENLHKKIMAESVEFEDLPDEVENIEVELPKEEKVMSDKKPFIDPFNRQEPEVREYVMKDQFAPEDTTADNFKNQYNEPHNFSEAFDLPDDNYNPPPSNSKSSRPSNSGGGSSSGAFNMGGNDSPEVDPARARRRSKRFAKQIVDLTCGLMEVGFVWYCSKDITEAKLAEYELTGEMDLSLLLEMDGGQQVTVKEFFLSQLGAIQEASKIEQDDKDDLTDALTEVFMEKNIQPKPEWNLVLSAITIAGKQVVKGFAITSAIKGVMVQLKEMKKDEPNNTQNSYQEPIFTPPPTPAPVYEQQKEPGPIMEFQLSPAMQQEIDDDLEILKTIETKE
jgi:hypothetical protein